VIARAQHTGAQKTATKINRLLATLFLQEGRSAEIQWVKGHDGTPGNEKAGELAGKAAEKEGPSIASLKLRISERFRAAMEAYPRQRRDPPHHRRPSKERLPPELHVTSEAMFRMVDQTFLTYSCEYSSTKSISPSLTVLNCR
jgi:hypothetical protein